MSEKTRIGELASLGELRAERRALDDEGNWLLQCKAVAAGMVAAVAEIRSQAENLERGLMELLEYVDDRTDGIARRRDENAAMASSLAAIMSKPGRRGRVVVFHNEEEAQWAEKLMNTGAPAEETGKE